MRAAWFTTASTFSNEVTGIAKPDTTLTIDKHLPPIGNNIDIWAIARDKRDDDDTVHYTLVFH